VPLIYYRVRLLLRIYAVARSFLRMGIRLFLDESHIIDLGILPVLRKNGAYPVLSARAEFTANSMEGNFATQSVCFESTHCRSIWVIVLLARSVDPSVSGWYALDILSLVPINWFNRVQKALVNRTSRSLIMCFGSPCNL
jgi:hypothetical protein